MLSHDQLMQQIHVGNSSITLYTYLAYAWTKVQQSNKENRNGCFETQSSKLL